MSESYGIKQQLNSNEKMLNSFIQQIYVEHKFWVRQPIMLGEQKQVRDSPQDVFLLEGRVNEWDQQAVIACNEQGS